MNTIAINSEHVRYARRSCSSFEKAINFLQFLDKEATQAEAATRHKNETKIEPSALGAVIHTVAQQDHACSAGAFLPEVLKAQDTPEEARTRARAAATELFYKLAIRYIASIFCACGMNGPYIPMTRFREIISELSHDHRERKNFFAWVGEKITLVVDTCDESLTNEEIPFFTREAAKLGPKGATWLLYVISAYVRSIITEQQRRKTASDFDKLSPEVQKFLAKLEM